MTFSYSKEKIPKLAPRVKDNKGNLNLSLIPWPTDTRVEDL